MTNRHPRRLRLTAATALTCLLPTLALAQTTTPATTSAQASRPHVLYVESNLTATGQNSILAYDIAGDGSLHQKAGSPYLTGGTGFFDATYALGPFDNDQNIILNPDSTVLYAINGGSNTIAVMHVQPDGSLVPFSSSPVAAHGATPISLGLHGNTLVTADYAINPAAPDSDIAPRLNVFGVAPGGSLNYLPYTEVYLHPGADPSQVLTSNTGPFVFTSGFPSGSVIDSYAQLPGGYLFRTGTVTPPVENGSNALVLGLWANPRAPYVYAGLVVNNLLATYRINELGQLTLVGTATDSGQGLCWLRTSRDGHYLYASNTGDQSISVFDLSNPAHPVEIQHVVAGGVGGFNQFSLDPGENFLYVLQEENSVASAGKSNKVYAYKVDHATGRLTFLSNLTVSLPVPSQTRTVGLAIR